MIIVVHYDECVRERVIGRETFTKFDDTLIYVERESERESNLTILFIIEGIVKSVSIDCYYMYHPINQKRMIHCQS